MLCVWVHSSVCRSFVYVCVSFKSEGMSLCLFNMSVLLVYRECVGVGGFVWVCMGDVYESVLMGVKIL